MATTSNTYTGNGSNKLFSITFPYLETTDVDVYLNGTLQTITTQYTFANATTIEFVTAPANGAVVLLDRSTDDATLQATFFPGSSIKAADLNLDFDQVLYIAQETSNEATTATSTAASATATANTALSQSSAAVSTANTASSNASAAVSTANTASTNASNAVTTANTASSNATTAVNTANAATSTANTASSNASAAVSTANTASSNASAAVSTANTASSNASAAVSTANAANSTANTASGNASTAVTTANNAVTTANTANSNSNTAVTTANAAAAAVANAVLYTTVANVAAIPGSPANNAAVEVTNSTGIESFTPLSGLPAGFIGSSGLSVRIIYQTSGATWTWIQYFPNDPETRYLKLAGGTLTGSITVPQGTVASPGIKFSGTGNDNTGVYSSGIDELGLVTNGVNRLSIDSAGAISIPGTLGVTGAVTGTSTVSGSALIPTGSSVPSNGVYLPAANSVAISTNSSQRLLIDSAGNVGVGISPSYKFDVAGALRFRSQGYLYDSAGTSQLIRFTEIGARDARMDAFNGTDFNGILRYAGANLVFETGTGASVTERLRITSAGNVGIGTTSPVDTLHVVGSARVGDGTNFAGVTAGSSGAIFEAAAGSANVLFKTGGSERGRFDSSGRLLVGTSTSTSTANTGSNQNIQVQGTSNYANISVIGNVASAAGGYLTLAKSRSTTPGGFTVVIAGDELGAISFEGADGSAYRVGASIGGVVDGTPGAGDMPGRLVFSTTADGAASPTERMRIRANGNISLLNGVAFGSSSDPGTAFAIGGSILSSGAGTHFLKWSNVTGNVTYDTSSRLVKENIVDSPYGIDAVKQLQPRKYFRTDDKCEEIGFIADEVVSVLPEFVPLGAKSLLTRNEDDTEIVPLGVNYDKLTAVLTKALQEAIAKIETLEAKVAALETA